MKPETYLKKLKDKLRKDCDKEIERLREKQLWYKKEKYPEDMYGCRYMIYWDRCDDEIRQWERVRSYLDGCQYNIPAGQRMLENVAHARNAIYELDKRLGSYIDRRSQILMEDLSKYISDIGGDLNEL